MLFCSPLVEFSVSKFGMYISKFGMYVSNFGTYVSNFETKKLQAQKNSFAFVSAKEFSLIWGCFRLIAHLMLRIEFARARQSWSKLHSALAYSLIWRFAPNRLTLSRAQASLALPSLSRLFPRILVSNGTVLELLANNLHLLEVLLTVFPLLLVVDAVATCALQLLHR